MSSKGLVTGSMHSHYRILGVEPEADPVAIRSAYLALMRRFHPDRGGEEADPARAQAVTAAWEVLRDPERRAAYDETRKAHFEPGGGPARAAKVRGGAAGRNLFLLLAAATVGLGWWALQQPQFVPPVRVAVTVPRPAPRLSEPEIRPEADREAMHRRIAVEEPASAPDPDPPREEAVETPIEVPPPEPVERRVRMAEPPSQVRRQAVPERGRIAARTTRETRASVVSAAPAINLAPLERHLQLLTEQSFRFGTAAKRTRLEATRESFDARLRSCDDDACRRDAYLRRNAEVGEIMRNR